MPKRAKRSIHFKLPEPTPQPKKKRERCDECGEVMDIGRGYGYCTACQSTTPLPIGRVLSKGPYRGKYVYLKSAFMREMGEEYDSERDARFAFEEELKCRDYLIIEEIEP
jgi:hypothetical protein